MLKLLLTATAILFVSVKINFAQTVIIPDTPNVGDTTTITTVTTGNPVTTNNLISQDFNDGSWVGTMYPDNSDINESTWLTGKDDKYAQTTINSEDYVTLDELKLGFTSNFGAQIRWWNPTESTVTMTQTANNGVDTTTQSTTFEDTTNHNYQLNNYGNTLTMNADPNMTHGTMTYRFDFDIQGNKNYNGGHAGVDVTDPTATVDYQVLSSTTVTTVEYCWQKNPPTCPGQDELAAVDTMIDTFEENLEDLYLDDIYYYEEQSFIPEAIDFEYSFNDNYFEEEEFEIQDDYLAFDDFFFEEQYFEDDYYEEFDMEEYIPEDMAFEELEYFEEMPEMKFEEEYFEEFTMNELPPMEEMYFGEPEYFEEDMYFEEEMYIEVFTDDAFIEEFDEMFEEMPIEEMSVEMAEEMFEEMFEEYFEEEPPMEMVEEFKEEIIEEPMEEPKEMEVAMAKEEVMEETDEVMEEPTNEVEEQPSSEEPIADKPQETTEDPQQEETIEEPVEVAVVEGNTTEEPTTPDENVEVNLDLKVAAIEKVIKSQIKNTIQQTEATLNVINEVVSREMVAMQPDMSSYMNMNQALFDTKQLPKGNPAFFDQINLESYSNDIYTNVASLSKMIGSDPIVQHQLKMEDAQNNTKKAYFKLKELLDARNIQ